MLKENRTEMMLVHFNNKHPENMNLCISNLKNDYVWLLMVKNGL